MPSQLQKLRETNRRLPEWLDHLLVRHGQAAVATAEQISGLLSELSSAGAALRAEPIPAKGANPELDGELEKYRLNVERLHRMLPAIHSQLLLERARLESQRARVRAAAEWAHTSRQTL